MARILDAAVDEFSEHGYDAATTARIAERAKVPIGSIYQFFADKEELFDAVAERYLDELRDLWGPDSVPQAARGDLEAILAHAVDTVAAYLRREPGVRAVWLSMRLSPRMIEASNWLHEELVEEMEGILIEHGPPLSRPVRARAAAMLVEVTTAISMLSVQQMDRRLMTELKRLLGAYVRDLKSRS